ncbi:unnamed protein product [Phytophthora fragariaefolia]|uniref:Unnamed protein product n=1 Tax=Phytophthora fragariaefolia TaxID=1490495 RepID=A0A9W6Y9W1_9STRA|nr:unnamed protein product [Phytophthora fragariaefolia]
MSDASPSPSPSPSPPSPSPPAALPGSERADYRGKCLYKTGKCRNERALKTSGAAHNLCDEHRNRQNQHQRKLDAKNRLHKRERRKAPKGERFAPYPAAHRPLPPAPVDASDDADDAVAGGDGAAPAPVLATASSGVMFLPHGPQPPQVSYPFVMQDFDGIVVPLPSYLEGQERIEFRSRIYQKVLDFISEECILRFGAKVESASADEAASDAAGTTTVTRTSLHGLEAEPQASEETAGDASLGQRHEHEAASDDQASPNGVVEADEARTTGISGKKVH